MGQQLPLPERIPMPNDEQLQQLNEIGCTIILDAVITDNTNNTTNTKPSRPSEYVKYNLPSGWKMVDSSWRRDLPDFYIIDDKQMKRVSISGSWKGAYDNKLRLRVYSGEEIKFYEPPIDNTVECSETSNANIIGKFGEVIDEQKRPYNKQERESRFNDYESK